MTTLQILSWHARPSRWVLSALAAVALGAVFPLSAMAADVRSGDTISVGPDEVVADDLYAFGNSVVVQGIVRGDVIAAGSTVTVTGHVTGNVIAAGSMVTVNGPVDGSVRIAGNTLTVAAPVANDVLLAGATAGIAPPATVGRDVLAGGSAINLQAPVGRNVKAGGGTLTVGSTVGGSVEANVDELVLTSDAAIAGPVTYTSPNEARTQSGAQSAELLHRTPPPAAAPPPWVIGGIDLLGWLRGFVGLAIFGGLLLLAFPRASQMATTTVEQRWLPSLGLGFALVAGLPMLALLIFGLGLLVGGWWIGLLGLALYAALLVTGAVVAAAWLGTATLRLAHQPDVHPVVALLLGLFIAGAVQLLPVVGAVAVFAMMVVGAGALALTGWHSYRGAASLTPAASLPPAPLRAAA